MATIDLRNVNHVFPGNVPGVKDAFLRMNAGEFVSIVFFKVTLVSALPTIFSGLPLSLIYALLVLILLSIIGVALTWAMGAVEKRLLRWK